ncbi:hypothetical protein A5695_26860 [Mycobacterium sp. E1747]|nr:hypothetical protein A5695_26860 [Mycobacterium sp. E1747]
MPLPVNTVVATVARMPAVNGVAVGEGLAFTLVPDVRVAWEHAGFGSVRAPDGGGPLRPA